MGGHLQQVIELLSHQCGIANWAMKYTLINEKHERRWAFTLKKLLSAQSSIDSLYHLFVCGLRAITEDVVGVFLCLKEPGDEQGIP